MTHYFKKNYWVTWFFYSGELSKNEIYQYRLRMLSDVSARFYASTLIGIQTTLYIHKVGKNSFYFSKSDYKYNKCVIFCMISLLIDFGIFFMITLYHIIIHKLNIFKPLIMSLHIKNRKLGNIWVTFFVWLVFQYV